MTEKTYVNVYMDLEMVQRLQEVADQYSRSMGTRLNRSDIVRLACSKFLEGRKIVDVQELPGPEGHMAVPVVITEGPGNGK